MTGLDDDQEAAITQRFHMLQLGERPQKDVGFMTWSIASLTEAF